MGRQPASQGLRRRPRLLHRGRKRLLRSGRPQAAQRSLGPGRLGRRSDQGFIEKISPKNAMSRSSRPPSARARRKARPRGAAKRATTCSARRQFKKAAGQIQSRLQTLARFAAGGRGDLQSRPKATSLPTAIRTAEDDYALLIKKFPSSQYVSQVVMRRFAIGRYWEQSDEHHHHWALTPNFIDKTRPMLDTMGNALKVYERIRLDDPTGPLADDAVMAAANAHFVRGHWEEADYHFGLLRSEFPKSEYPVQSPPARACAASCCATRAPATKGRRSTRPKNWPRNC